MKMGGSSPRQPGGYASFPEDEGAISDETGGGGGGDGGGTNYQPPQYWALHLLTNCFLFWKKESNDCKSGKFCRRNL